MGTNVRTCAHSHKYVCACVRTYVRAYVIHPSIHTYCYLLLSCNNWSYLSGEYETSVLYCCFYVHGKHLRSCRDGQLT